MQKLTHEQILKLRESNKELDRLPVCLLLDNIRSSYNVGSMFRVADGARLERILLTGITSSPDNIKVKKTALGAEETVPWEYHVEAVSAVEKLSRQGYQIIALEHTQNSQVHCEFNYSFPLCLVLGNEVNGVDPKLIAHADDSIEIPMLGEKNSLNVSTAGSIAIYEILRQYTQKAK